MKIPSIPLTDVESQIGSAPRLGDSMNQQIIAILEDLAFYSELASANPFKIKALHNGARVIQGLPDTVETMLENGELAKTKGIGKGLISIISDVVANGESKELKEASEQFPAQILELREIPGLGPKKIKALYENFSIASISELEYACHENRLVELKGFGAKSQEKIIRALDELRLNRGKVLLPVAEHLGHAIHAQLKKIKRIHSAEVVGELRRLNEVIASLDFLIDADASSEKELLQLLANLPIEWSKNAQKSDTEVSATPAVLVIHGTHEDGINVRFFLRQATTEISLAAQKALLTGPEAIRSKLNKNPNALEKDSEIEVFAAAGIPFLAPEVRDNPAPIAESAQLIECSDIKGVFHLHTTASDGANSLAEMAEKCRALGFSYMGVSDHSQSAFYAGGLKKDAIEKQREEIASLNAQWSDFKIFHGIESDILANGELDYPDSILAKFDFVIASVHGQFQMKPDDMTKRICRALSNPYTTWLGHPTGRLLLGRKGYEFDFDEVFATAAKEKKGIELNSNPYRLDLDWRHLQKAGKLKIDIGIFPDAHSARGLEDFRYGVMMARKGGLTVENISNTKSLKEMEAWLAKK